MLHFMRGPGAMAVMKNKLQKVLTEKKRNHPAEFRDLQTVKFSELNKTKKSKKRLVYSSGPGYN